ncbi:hypothetical protein DM02DRAFT_512225 [Periconia macrospinosa]|uniref:Mei2-like C-terminal RNA recognition motif domain-containing protein n=1 Tax=Periconia macrospinosa TaxID=97972 RepID=A0A2V1EE50_9PLEO|nr:hypothetical protein DM02DRAFT_512225 [Periconia macrospinosa]
MDGRDRGAGGQSTQPIVNGIRYVGLTPQPYPLGTFSNELESTNPDTFVSRYLFVSHVLLGHAGYDMEAEINDVVARLKMYRTFLNTSLFYSDGVYLRFDDLGDACDGVAIFQNEGFQIRHIDSYDFARAKTQDTMSINEFEGQIRLTVHVTPTDQYQPTFDLRDLAWLNQDITDFLMVSFGSVKTTVHVDTDQVAMLFTYRIEFHSVDAANRAVASINSYPRNDVHEAVTDMLFQNPYQWSTFSAAGWNGPRAPNSPHRHKVRYDDMGRMTSFPHQPPTPTGQNNSSHPAESHNRVRRDPILKGEDVRTTIMLRNIPNKLDWMALKTLLDRVCFGLYDFLYLRIDFKTCNNVGYAFINFVDLDGVIAMLDKVESRSWRGFKSNKFAEISYATIQGKDALIQKFRNSSVMAESPFCRPHLFLTYADAFKENQPRNTGTLQDFPQPDNWSKLQRSLNSARAVGLFPPSGIVNANIQRSMVSAYDRGTPRDLVHTMQTYRQNDSSDQGISQYERRQCEAWYATRLGLGRNSEVNFDEIPYGSVQQFLAMTRGPHHRAAHNLGPIGPPRTIQGFFNAQNPNYNPGMMVARPSVPRGHFRGAWPHGPAPY